MNIVMVKVKTNRYYRHSMNRQWLDDVDLLTLTNDELDDLDNIFSGCAFE